MAINIDKLAADGFVEWLRRAGITEKQYREMVEAMQQPELDCLIEGLAAQQS